MKILQLSHKLPFPPLDGGSIVIHSLTQGLLNQGHQVKMLTIISPKRKIVSSDITSEYKNSVGLTTVSVDTNLKVIPALKNLLFQKESYHTSRYESEAFEAKIVETLKTDSYDIIQMESIFVLRYLDLIRKNSKAKVVLRTQNIEHVIWENIVTNEKNPIKKFYLKEITRRLKKYELENMQQVDAIIPITNFDEDYIVKNCPSIPPIKAIPFGINLDKFKIEFSEEHVIPNSIFHLGSMDWFPNIEAVNWFLDEIWKPFDLEKKVSLFLAGKFMPPRIQQMESNKLNIAGWIDSPIEYMSDKQIMIVPLLSGSGIRVKIIEGMALGKVVISTTLGANGINCTKDENILIADTPNEFYQAILKCTQDKKFCQRIGQNAKTFAMNEYDNTAITSRFLQFYKSLL